MLFLKLFFQNKPDRVLHPNQLDIFIPKNPSDTYAAFAGSLES